MTGALRLSLATVSAAVPSWHPLVAWRWQHIGVTHAVLVMTATPPPARGAANASPLAKAVIL